MRVAIIVDNQVENIITIEEENLNMLSDVEYIISENLQIGDFVNPTDSRK